ncbi:SEC-C metal-binding domain-containing protein [uncultured Clostridium sp.]|uniref:SEC-C metal-binding domain-containing protein n=1 Tax=uncultured Clostridium sp. TaxID=59620 RepID=UPI00260A1958|nr:SEC-C metal-binding domain-containing protein [uncultured Clostridium sp.]
MEGKCYFCGKDVTNRTAKRHAKTCSVFQEKNEEGIKLSKSLKERFIIKINDKETKKFTLYIVMDSYLKLRELDNFIRDIWVECCNHLSLFKINGERYFSNTEINDGENQEYRLEEIFDIGDKFDYEYDFGTTTYLEGEIIDKIKSGDNAPQIEIIIRNNKIGAVNSPREDECGYVGNIDIEEKYKPGNSTKLSEEKKSLNNITELSSRMNSHLQAVENEEALEGYFNENLIEDFMKKVEKSFQKDLKRKLDWSSKEIISYLNKNEIKYILDRLSIMYLENAKKAELVNIYMDNYVERYKEIFTNIPIDIYEDLMELKKNNYNMDIDYLASFNKPEVLNELGIANVGTNNKSDVRFFIPKEIAKLIEETEFDINRIEKNSEILNFSKGLTRYYGVIPIFKLGELLVEYEIIEEKEGRKKDILMYGLDAMLKIGYLGEISVLYEDGLVIDSGIVDVENIIQILDDEREYKIFPKYKIENYKDAEEIVEEKEFKKLRNFIESLGLDRDMANSEIEDFYYMYQLESKEEIEKMIEEEYPLPEEIKVKLKNILFEALDSIPCWRLKGYSQKEVDGINYKVIEKVKMGRNELCPCGSGKKFKMCCGQKVIKVNFKDK